MVHGSWFMVNGSWLMVHGSWLKVNGSRLNEKVFQDGAVDTVLYGGGAL